MTYKESLTAAMDQLALDPKVRFVGYGLLHGRAAGTLKNVPVNQIVETPVAENLMVGMAIGMSLAGLRPVVYIERMDFILNALDAIVNHLDKISTMSRGEFNPAIILRVVVGNRTRGEDGNKLLTGATHTQDFTGALQEMISFPVIPLSDTGDLKSTAWIIKTQYVRAVTRQRESGESTMLVEYKDLI